MKTLSRKFPFSKATASIRAAAIAFGLVLGCLTSELAAQTASSQSSNTNSRVSNRWLLVVETSGAMQARADWVQRIVSSLALSGMNGQMLPGDTLGLWTFNRELHAGQFPLQEWTLTARRAIASRAFQFLAAQKYGGEPQMAGVIPSMQSVITNSEFITVILISSGSENIHGTPFDDRINSYYATWKDQQQKVAAPFITILRAVHGQIKSYAVNSPPWPLEMPAVSPELIAARTPPKPVEPPKPPPPVYGKPLIILGNKPEPEANPAAPAAANTNASAIEATATSSISATKTTPAEQPSEKPATKPNALIVTNNLDSAANVIATNAPTEPRVMAATTKPISSTPTTQAPPVAAKSDLPNATSGPASISESDARTDSRTIPAESSSTPRANSDAQTAVATPAESAGSNRMTWIAAGALLAAAFATVLLIMRRSRKSEHISLITRSLDRDQK